MRRGRNPSPHFGHIGANDSPEARCGKCGARYNPYKHGLGGDSCPHCDGEGDDSDES